MYNKYIKYESNWCKIFKEYKMDIISINDECFIQLPESNIFDDISFYLNQTKRQLEQTQCKPYQYYDIFEKLCIECGYATNKNSDLSNNCQCIDNSDYLMFSQNNCICKSSYYLKDNQCEKCNKINSQYTKTGLIKNENNFFLISLTEEKITNELLAGPQYLYMTTLLNNGNYVIVWQDQHWKAFENNPPAGHDGSGTSVWARIINSCGDFVTNEFLVNSYTYGDQSLPRISNLKNGGFIIVWMDGTWALNKYTNGQDNSLGGVYAQIYDSNGLKVNSEFRINQTTEGFQGHPYVIKLQNGGFVVTWMVFINKYDVMMRIYNKNNEPISNEIIVNKLRENDQWKSSGCSLSNGNFVISWSDGYEFCYTCNGNDGSGWGIYAQIYSEIGETIGENFILNSSTQGHQIRQNLKEYKDGFISSWNSCNIDISECDVYLRIFNNNGEPQTGDIKVNSMEQKYCSTGSIIILNKIYFGILVNCSNDFIVIENILHLIDIEGHFIDSISIGLTDWGYGYILDTDGNDNMIVIGNKKFDSTDYDITHQVFSYKFKTLLDLIDEAVYGIYNTNEKKVIDKSLNSYDPDDQGVYDLKNMKVVNTNQNLYNPTQHGLYQLNQEKVIPYSFKAYNPEINDLYSLSSEKKVDKEKLVYDPSIYKIYNFHSEKVINISEESYDTFKYSLIEKNSTICSKDEKCTKRENIFNSDEEKVISKNLLAYNPYFNDLCEKGKSVNQSTYNTNICKEEPIVIKDNIQVINYIPFNPVYITKDESFSVIMKTKLYKITDNSNNVLLKDFKSNSSKIDLTILNISNYQDIHISEKRRLESVERNMNDIIIQAKNVRIIIQNISDSINQTNFIFSEPIVILNCNIFNENKGWIFGGIIAGISVIIFISYCIYLKYRKKIITNKEINKENHKFEVVANNVPPRVDNYENTTNNI